MHYLHLHPFTTVLRSTDCLNSSKTTPVTNYLHLYTALLTDNYRLRDPDRPTGKQRGSQNQQLFLYHETLGTTVRNVAQLVISRYRCIVISGAETRKETGTNMKLNSLTWAVNQKAVSEKKFKGGMLLFRQLLIVLWANTKHEPCKRGLSFNPLS